MRIRCVWLLCWLPFCATAEVLSQSERGFVVQHSLAIKMTDTQQAWKGLIQVSRWWHPEHTWSGDSKNLVFTLTPGGCFCENLPRRGFVEHLHVVYVDRGRLLRLRGGLGPLQEHALDGTLEFSLLQGKDGVQLTLSYRVHGYIDGGLAAWAEPVDKVLAVQARRLQMHLNGEAL